MSEIISNANVNKTVKKTVKKTKISDQTEQEVQINDLTEEHYVREEVRDEVEGDKFNATIEVTNLLSKTLENLAKKLASNCITETAKRYNFDAESAINHLGLENLALIRKEMQKKK